MVGVSCIRRLLLFTLPAWVCISYFVGWRLLYHAVGGRATKRKPDDALQPAAVLPAASLLSPFTKQRSRKVSSVGDIFNSSYGKMNTQLNLSDWTLFENKSSLDYYGCCGAGHRLMRTATAYYIANLIHFGLRVFWGWCADVEVYDYLFGPEPLEDLERVTSEHNRTVFSNEIPQFIPVVRRRSATICKCSDSKIKMDAKYFNSLRQRFSQRHRVDDFRRKYFQHAPLTIGLHIRAGNNETGHFVNKKRTIDNTTEWLDNVAGHIHNLLFQHGLQITPQDKPPVLHIATDTPSFFRRLESILNETLLVLQNPHPLQRKEGEGVIFGGAGASKPQGFECLKAWESIIADMLILSQVDILEVPRSSSFSQGLPLSLAFARRQAREQVFPGTVSSSLPPAYCEMDRQAKVMECFKTYTEWCCNGTADQPDFLLVPARDFDASNLNWIQAHRRDKKCKAKLGGRTPKRCIPFRWKSKH